MTSLLSTTDLRERGFTGFVPLRNLDAKSLPSGPAVYAVLRPDSSEPVFLDANPGGRWKGKDPTVARERLTKEWLTDVECVYLGKADSLSSRIDLLLRFAGGEAVMHWGGRLLWQVGMDYLFAWRETPGEDPEVVEKQMLREFSSRHGCLPFANLRH